MLSKLKTCLKNPKLALSAITRKNYKWGAKNNLKTKDYRSYDEYITHQKEKLGLLGGMLEEIDKLEGALRGRLMMNNMGWYGKSVLCLGARLGQEVRAFNSLGCFAVGIDLNPGNNNKNVLVGDFHNLVWGESTLDVIYTNSLDHSFDLTAIVNEITRVLKGGGLLVLELSGGSKEGCEFGYYESMAWERISDVIDIFKGRGFEVILMEDIVGAYKGKFIIMKLKK
jgi:SAM-dependent methyltransferase